MATEGLELDPLEFLVCPLSICRLSVSKVLHCVVDGFLVPRTLRFQTSDFTSSATPSAFSLKHSDFSNSEPNPELVSGIHSVDWICEDLFCQHSLTK